MAQYKKDLVKENIDSAALTVFAKKGYQGTKIADISDHANVSVGNIYKYYKNKEAIFLSVAPESFMERLKSVLFNKIVVSKKNSELLGNVSDFWMNNQEPIEFLVENRELVLIMLGHCIGTKYENAKEELIQFLITSAKETKHIRQSKIKDIDFILKLIYSAMIDITLKVLEEKSSLKEVKENLLEINKYHLFGINELLR